MTIPEGDFDGYIFDHDGTLALSMHVHFDGFRAAFEKNGANFDFTREIAQFYAGVGLHDTVVLLNERFGTSMVPDEVVRDQEAYYFANLHRVVPYRPVVDYAEARLAEGKPISVASGSQRVAVGRTMKAIGIDKLFEIVVTQDDVERSKPEPDLFLLAAEKMGVAPEKCLVFEDSKFGIEAADRIGMASVYVQPDDPE